MTSLQMRKYGKRMNDTVVGGGANGKEEFIQMQRDEAVQQEMIGVTVRMVVITCRCGWVRALTKMYKCLYCGEWFCHRCAELHFSQTVLEYKADKQKAEEND